MLVGTDHQTWEGVIGSEGEGKRKSNGLLLLGKCAEHDLLITNTVFKLPNRNKTSWMHTRSKHGHLIDYDIVRRTDRHDVIVTKTMCGADCWTDHILVVSKLNLRIQLARLPQGKKAPKRLDVSKLNHDSMRQAFINDISNQLGAMNLSSEDPEENWTVFQKVVHSSAASTIGHPSNTKIGLTRMIRKLSCFLNKKAACTRHIKMILALYQRRLPTAIFVRQSKTGSVTCKTPG